MCYFILCYLYLYKEEYYGERSVSSDARHWISMLWDTAGESKGRPHPSPLHCVEREQRERGRQQYPKGVGLTPALSTAWRGSRGREVASSIQRAWASPQPSPLRGEGAEGERSPAVSKGRGPHPSPLHCVEREQRERGRQQYPKGVGLTPALSTAWRGSR